MHLYTVANYTGTSPWGSSRGLYTLTFDSVYTRSLQGDL
jgi:hypothetical protein